MSSRLERIHNWPELARKAQYRIGVMACIAGVSTRVLERHFKEHFQETPREWLWRIMDDEMKRLEAVGESRKVIAAELGYSHASNFRRAFPSARYVIGEWEI